MSAPVLELSGVTKVFPARWSQPRVLALDNVDLRIDAGEVFGFIGPNGAGKSTTIKLVMGFTTATSGIVRLNGLDAHDPASRRMVGFVPENPAIPDFMTPWEVLEMSLRLHGVTLADERARIGAWLERFDLSSAARRQVGGFSKGMVQRTALAQAMVTEPRMLILDEPLSGLDPIGRRDVVDILSDYRKRGGTLFFSSHVLHDVERIADRFGLIHKGRLRTVQSPAELLANEATVTVRSIGVTPVEGMRNESDSRWSGLVPKADLWAMLAALRSAGHELIEVRPSLNLETVFLSAVADDARPPADGGSRSVPDAPGR